MSFPSFFPFLFRVTVLALLLGGVPSAPLYAQVSDADAAMMIGQGLGEALGGAITAAQRMGASAAEASREIEAARRAYWEALRTGRDVEEARHAFAHQLRGKDFLYMWMAIPAGVEGSHYQLFERMSPVDGGIRPWARFEFMEWINAIRTQLGAYGDRFITPAPARVAEALEATRPAYEAYIRARDWAEMDDSGLTWPWDTDARAQAIMILRRYRESTVEEAEKTLGEWFELAGEEHVLGVADRIRTAPRDAMSNLANPAALGLRTTEAYVALVHLVRTRDALTCFKWYLWQEDSGNRAKTLAEAEREFERFVWAYGAEAVEAIGRQIMAPGQYIFPPMGLRRNHPEARLREAAAFSKEVTARAQVDELYHGLVQNYEESELLEATDAVFRRERGLRARNLQQLQEKHDGDRYAMLIELLEKGVATILDAPLPMGEGIALIYNPNPTNPTPQERMSSSEAVRQARPMSFVGAAGGVIYGLTRRAIYRMNADGSDFQVLHQFNYLGKSEFSPHSAPHLRLGSDGVLYGAEGRVYTEEGRLSPTHGSGALFRINTDGSAFEYIVNMREHGISGPTLLLIDEAGTLFGFADSWQGGRHKVLFHVKGDGSDFQLVSGIPHTDALVDGGDGYLYGLNSNITMRPTRPPVLELFRVDPRAGDHVVIHRFDMFEKVDKLGDYGLILGSDHRLYGARRARVRDNEGRELVRRHFFRLNRDGSDFQVILVDDLGTRAQRPQSEPLLVEGPDGLLYTLVRDPENPRDHENLIGIGKDGQLLATLRTPAANTQHLLAHEGMIFGLDRIRGGLDGDPTPGIVYRFEDAPALHASPDEGLLQPPSVRPEIVQEQRTGFCKSANF